MAPPDNPPLCGRSDSPAPHLPGVLLRLRSCPPGETTLKSKLSKYTGGLEPPQIACGMNAARRNARRLAEDAKLLLEAGRYPTATALAVLSIEESGKTSILRGFASIPDTERQRRWQEYRSHRKKNAMWILPSLVASAARDLDSLAPAANVSGEHTALLDQLKQISLYTDCLGNAHWSEPEKIIESELAKHLVSTADLLARDCSAPGSLDTSLSHAAGLIEIAACHA